MIHILYNVIYNMFLYYILYISNLLREISYTFLHGKLPFL